MRRGAVLAGMLVAMLGAGCVLSSLHPLFTEEDLRFDPKLLGEWTLPDESEEVWVFERRESGYLLTIRSEQGTALFEAHLLELGEHRFLDARPHEQTLNREKIGGFEDLLIRSHAFVRVDRIGETFEMSHLNPEWLGRLLEHDPQALRHVVLPDNRLILTASTKELQQFMQKHAGNPEAFSRLDALIRRPPLLSLVAP